MGILDRIRRGGASSDEQPKKTPYLRAKGGSGRAHSQGFLDLEELNNELRHPHGHKIFDRMYRTDPDVGAAIDMALAPILSGTWQTDAYREPGKEDEEPAEQDVQIAAEVHELLFGEAGMHPTLPGHLREFMPVLMRSGFAIGEQVWRAGTLMNEQRLVLDRVEMRLPRSIWRFFQANGRLSAVEQMLPAGVGGAGTVPDSEGGSRVGSGGGGPGQVVLQRRDLVYYRLGGEGDNWEGVSLLRRAYKPWKLKDGGERLDAVAQEREALGVPVAYVPASATDDQLDSIEAALQSMRAGDQSYVMVPGQKAGQGAMEGNGWLIEILGYDRSGSGRDPQPMLAYHGQKIQAAFFQQFMGMSGGRSGSKAATEMQADPFMTSVEVLAGVVEDVIREDIIARYVAFNHAGAKGLPKVKLGVIDQTSLSQLSDFVLKLTQVGALIPDARLERYLRDRSDLPEPLADEDDMARRRALVIGVDPEAPTAEESHQMAMDLAKAGAIAPGAPAGGGGANDDPYGQNAKPDGKKNVKDPSAKKTGAPQGRGGAGQGPGRGPAKD